MEGRCKTLFKGAHEYHINSLNLNSDGENFLSADDLRINIWNLSNNSTVYNVLDIKPKNVNDIEEAINYAEFNKSDVNTFLYTTSKGFLSICDLRERATFINGQSLRFEVGAGVKRNAFTEIINGISCAKFLQSNNNVVVSRDYLSVKLWDIRSTSIKPFLNL